MKNLRTTAVLCISLVLFSAVSASAAVLANYDPAGWQEPGVSDLAPALVDPAVAATSLSNHGPGFQYANGNVRPVRVGPGPLDTVGGFYIEFTLSAQNAGSAVQLSTIQYDYRSYCDGETFTISLMTSADNFASVVDAVNVTETLDQNGIYAGSHTFDASTVPATQGNLVIRFYLHSLLNSCETDADGVIGWADIRSSLSSPGAPGTGITVNGDVVQPVATEPTTWGRVKALYAGQ